jgi:Alginate export
MTEFLSRRHSDTVFGLWVASLCVLPVSGVSAAEALNDDPVKVEQPKPSYSKPGMAAYNFMMDDALLGNSYEKPVWNLHDTLGLPDWLSVGVEQRTRYENISDAFKGSAEKNLPSSGGDQMIAFQNDIWVQAKFGKFRFATEFLDARTTGQDNSSKPNGVPYPVNNSSADTLDFAQVFFSWADQNTLNSGIGSEFKLGRQTMDLGSRRLVARPVYRNTVNNFTGLRARGISYDNWQVNTFVTMPVIRYPNYVSASPYQNLQNHQQWNQEDTHSWFSGGILEGYNIFNGIKVLKDINALKETNAEIYLYQLDENDSNSPVNATRNRHYFTPGLRFYQKPAKGKFDFQAEGMGQYGTVNYAATGTYANRTQTHEAYSSHLEAGYSFDMPWSPRFFLEYDYATGSKNWANQSASGTDGRFDPLYGASDFDFGPTGIYGAFQRSNINSPGYKFNFSPRNDLEFSIQQRLVWLASGKDCWGGSTCTSATTPTLVNGNGSYVGDQFAFRGRYNFNSSLNFEAGWYHLFKGDFAKSAVVSNSSGSQPNSTTSVNGADTDYFFVTSQLRF